MISCPSTPRPMSTRSSTDSQTTTDYWMAEAIRIARERSGALAHPNPRVGAVLVRNGRKVGEGFHVYDNRDHAEIVALRQAGNRARGASLYINLEPCCTTGRTGPCTKALIEAGVREVYAAMKDPNPQVAGRGFAELRRAGITVQIGDQEEAARKINEDFAKWIKTGRPFVTLKTAATLDGRIALPGGKTTTAITGEAARAAAHRLFRHSADALLTGIGTVLIDDPLLTDRSGLPRRKPLLRVVLDAKLRMPLKSKLVTKAQGDLAVFTAQPLSSPRARALIRSGVDVVRLPIRGGHIDLHSALAELAKRQCVHVLIEAGANLNGAALAAGIVDKMAIFYAPKFIGGAGLPLAEFPRKQAFPVKGLTNLSVQHFEPDILIEGYFRDVYGDNRARRKN